jgi:hypothetical protein
VNKPGRVCLRYTKPRKGISSAHIVPAAAASRHIGNFREGLRLYVCVEEPLIRMRPIIGFSYEIPPRSFRSIERIVVDAGPELSYANDRRVVKPERAFRGGPFVVEA